MVRRIRGWLAHLVLGEYAEALDRVQAKIDRTDIETAIRESVAKNSDGHEALRAEIEEVKRRIDTTGAEVLAAEHAIGVG